MMGLARLSIGTIPELTPVELSAYRTAAAEAARVERVTATWYDISRFIYGMQ
jgi:hypothetical protein